MAAGGLRHENPRCCREAAAPPAMRNASWEIKSRGESANLFEAATSISNLLHAPVRPEQKGPRPATTEGVAER
jgi:hypothetical protein